MFVRFIGFIRPFNDLFLRGEDVSTCQTAANTIDEGLQLKGSGNFGGGAALGAVHVKLLFWGDEVFLQREKEEKERGHEAPLGFLSISSLLGIGR